MKYQDLTLFDRDLIRSSAIHDFSSTGTCCRYEAISRSVLSCIHSCGFDLKNSPKDLLKTLVKNIAPGYRSSSRDVSSDDVMEMVFKQLETLGVEIVKNERRTPTWSNPKKSWYTEYKNPKKPWEIL